MLKIGDTIEIVRRCILAIAGKAPESDDQTLSEVGITTADDLELLKRCIVDNGVKRFKFRVNLNRLNAVDSDWKIREVSQLIQNSAEPFE
ncbi:MAG: hypothetical protein AABO57_12765 [Acidobacteriota bacterium]